MSILMPITDDIYSCSSEGAFPKELGFNVLPHLSADGEPTDMEIELSAPAMPFRIDMYIGEMRMN